MNENQKSKKEVKPSNKKKVSKKPKEVGGSEGPEPTREQRCHRRPPEGEATGGGFSGFGGEPVDAKAIYSGGGNIHQHDA